jgi:hypothetical protein
MAAQIHSPPLTRRVSEQGATVRLRSSGPRISSVLARGAGRVAVGAVTGWDHHRAVGATQGS